LRRVGKVKLQSDLLRIIAGVFTIHLPEYLMNGDDGALQDLERSYDKATPST
jgi:hypothetical protein